MSRYTPDELKEIIRLHGLWLADADGGTRANLIDANLSRADLSCANLRGADLRGAYLSCANLSGAGKISNMRVFTGLYRYQCWAVVTEAGTPWVRMGCLFKSLTEWDAIGGIRTSNLSEFPDDGFEASEYRVRAFDFTRDAAERMAAKWASSNSPKPAQEGGGLEP